MCATCLLSKFFPFLTPVITFHNFVLLIKFRVSRLVANEQRENKAGIKHEWPREVGSTDRNACILCVPVGCVSREYEHPRVYACLCEKHRTRAVGQTSRLLPLMREMLVFICACTSHRKMTVVVVRVYAYRANRYVPTRVGNWGIQRKTNRIPSRGYPREFRVSSQVCWRRHRESRIRAWFPIRTLHTCWC